MWRDKRSRPPTLLLDKDVDDRLRARKSSRVADEEVVVQPVPGQWSVIQLNTCGTSIGKGGRFRFKGGWSLFAYAHRARDSDETLHYTPSSAAG